MTGLIEEISIKNVGGIASISMRLETGFTVITGESGAGKSSLVRALELIGGKRSQALFIRSGEDEASVEAVFPDLPNEFRKRCNRETRTDCSLRGVFFQEEEETDVSFKTKRLPSLHLHL